MVSWERLKVVLAVVEAGSFAGAAERLGVTPSAVSQAVRRLEEELGRPLLLRTSRSVSPTADGLALAERARMIEAILAETAASFAGDAPSAVLRLGVPADLAATLLPPVLAALSTEAEGLRLALSTDSPARLEAAFARGELDIAIVRRAPGPLGGREAELWREKLAWLGVPGVPWAAAAVVPLIVQEAPCRSRDLAMLALREWRGAWTIAHTASCVAAIWTAVRAGLGVTPLPASTRPPDLVVVPPGRLPALPEVAFVGLAGGPRESRWLERLASGLRAARQPQDVAKKDTPDKIALGPLNRA
jgi:DNA-binding transcriptional LysR family regulator